MRLMENSFKGDDVTMFRSKPTARRAAGAVLLAFLGLSAAAQTKPTEVKVEMDDLAGNYEFLVAGKTLIFRFFVDGGKLFITPPDEPSEALAPVKDKPLCFEIAASLENNSPSIKFVRNDRGVIDTCIVTDRGREFAGKKVVKS
jgi:hypothetical protein